MSKSNHISSTKIRKICTLWTHDDNFSRDDIVFNGDKFPELPTKPGTLLQIVALTSQTAERDFQPPPAARNPRSESPRSSSATENNTAHTHARTRRDSITITVDENGSTLPGGRNLDSEKAYVFSVTSLSADLRSKHANLQVSIAERVAKIFGFRNRMQVIVAEADEEKHEAHHVELVFRDEYLARADMWRMAIAELSKRTIYRGQKVLFMGTIKASVKHIYVNGQSVQSGYCSDRTRPVFRSESARYVLFIQMSKEMWDFDTEGAGEIMFNKVVNGFLPDLFKRWLRINAHHLVTIILFTRMQYSNEVAHDQWDPQPKVRCTEKPIQDYYRVVVSDMASGDWVNILYQLKKEFRAFLKEVSLVDISSECSPQPNGRNAQGLHVFGRPLPASQGNILEAITLAAAQFAKDYIDRDLVRTGISVIVVTPGTGVFEVDYNMLKLTTDSLMGSGIGIDLVCLSPMPLHSVPLFKYRAPRSISAMASGGSKGFSDKGNLHLHTMDESDRTPRQFELGSGLDLRHSSVALTDSRCDDLSYAAADASDEWRFAMPYWVDVSFWSGISDEVMELTRRRKSAHTNCKLNKASRGFSVRCRLYELQMMGVMEKELGDISIPYLREISNFSVQDDLPGLANKKDQNEPFLVQAGKSMPGSYSSRGDNEHDAGLDEGRRAQKAWMEMYDDDAFSFVPNEQCDRPARRPSSVPASEISSSYRDKHFPTSLCDVQSSPKKPSWRRADNALTCQSIQGRSGTEQPVALSYSSHHASQRDVHRMPRADVLQREKTSARHTERDSTKRRRRSGDAKPSDDLLQDPHGQSVSISRDKPMAMRKRNTVIGPVKPATSAVEPKSRPSNWIMRQISFGGKATIAQPSVTDPTTDISHGRVKPALLTVEKNQKGAIAERLASTRLTVAERPSQPIAIRTPSRADIPSTGSPSIDKTGRSVETIRGASHRNVPSSSTSTIRDPGSTFLLAGSRALGESILPKPTVSSSGGAKDIPRTLSPTSAIAPWAVMVNPCNPKKNLINPRNQFRRWHHVFPRALRTGSVKWRSLCSPAAVPLTHEWFPTAEQIATEYHENPYKIMQNEEDEGSESVKSREMLIRELIAFRLSHGFQIVVGASVAEFCGQEERGIATILAPDYMSSDGDTIFMSIGNSIHQLACVAGGEIEVKRFTRKPTTALESSAGIDKPFPYQAYIKTAFEQSYIHRDLTFQPSQKDTNWNSIDMFLAGYYDEVPETLQSWRARFVLIPVEIPLVNRRPLPMLAEDSEEEIRLEGIRKLTQLWQRHRYTPVEERLSQPIVARKQKDPNPLAIEYHTRDPSAIVAAGPEVALFHEADSEMQTSIFADSEKYQTSNIDLKRLGEDLQGERGIPMIDRRWHWKVHHTCFLGFDLVNWLLSNFADLETRDGAVELGNELMTKGLFVHVQKRHQFRDGNFFFQIAAEYRAPRPESRMGWFGMRKSDKSIPSTPLGDGPRTSPLVGKSSNSNKSRPSTADSSSASDSDQEGDRNPRKPGARRKVKLSRVMRYDVDNRKRSYRPEIISLHYDLLHSPDNCYHIRIDWMNVTAKLIEDAIVTWATSVEKYGLKLVEVPIAEAADIVDHHPFRSPYSIKLALQPPLEIVLETPNTSVPYIRPDPFAYHKALLRKQNFVLDRESASSFPPNVDVSYSWGKVNYKNTQFIHRSGTLLAQITNDGNFLVLANRLAHNRVKDSNRMRLMDPYEHKKTTMDGSQSSWLPSTPAVERANMNRSPFSSPLARPVQDSGFLHTAFQDGGRPPATMTPVALASTQTAEQVKSDLEAYCSDTHLLAMFYSEAFKQAPSPSPRSMPTLDNNIPSLGLPPAISIREASPASSGWTLNMNLRPGIGGMSESGIAGRRQGSEGSMSTLGKRTIVVDSSADLGPRQQQSRESLRSDDRMQ